MSPGPYARIYQSIWTDERFVAIREDDELLGGYVRLLMLAEAAWPQSVAIPRRLPQSTLDALLEAGVIELHPCDTYRVHGLDPERERRSAHGRDAVARRWAGRSDTPSSSPSNTQLVLAPRSRSLSRELRRESSTKCDPRPLSEILKGLTL
jgi:hypothetical protein